MGVLAGAIAAAGVWFLLDTVAKHIILARLDSQDRTEDLSNAAAHYVSALFIAAICAGLFGGMVAGFIARPRSLAASAVTGAMTPLLLVAGFLASSFLFHVPDLSGVPLIPLALMLAICGMLGGSGSQLLVTRYPDS